MENQIEETMKTLFEVFGICPDYKAQFTEDSWIEYYEPPINIYKQVPTYDYHKPEFELGIDKISYPQSKRVYLNQHTVKTEDGLEVTANFAVNHLMKTVFLKISPLREFGIIKQYQEDK